MYKKTQRSFEQVEKTMTKIEALLEACLTTGDTGFNALQEMRVFEGHDTERYFEAKEAYSDSVLAFQELAVEWAKLQPEVRKMRLEAFMVRRYFFLQGCGGEDLSGLFGAP